MPTSVIVAIGADLIGTAIADAIIFDLVAATTLDWVASYAVIQVGGSFIAGAAMRGALAGGSEGTPSSPQFTAAAEKRTHVVRSAVANRQIVYGRAMVSGPLVFAGSSSHWEGTGPDFHMVSENGDLYLVVALAGHEIDAVEEIWLNDDLATSDKFAWHIETSVHLGTADQEADPLLLALGQGWTEEHRLRGVAYMVIKLSYSRDIFPRGIPAVKAVIRGKKLYDPRTGKTGWSDNLALAVRDYLAGDYGLAATDAEIDDTSFIAAANICDERVALVAYSADATADAAKDRLTFAAAETGFKDLDGVTVTTTGTLPAPLVLATTYYLIRIDATRVQLAETVADARARIAIDLTDTGSGAHTLHLADESRYTCHGVLDTGGTPRPNMEALLSGCGGALTWPAGLWTLHVGAYEAPTVALDADDLAGPLQVRARVPRQDLYNAIKGTFCDPTQGWQPIDFPALTNATYAAQDGATIWRDVAFPVTTSSATAQRLAKMLVEKSRQGITVQAPFKLSAFKLSTWDNVTLTLAQMGWTDKVFKVTGWSFNEAGSVNLTLQEEAAACYTWSMEETVADPAPDTLLPAWDSVTAPGVPDVTETLFETTGSAGVKARATLSWAATTDVFVVDYLPEYRLGAGDWAILPATSGLAVEINDIAPGAYEFRVRARNALGVTSDYSATRAKTILGLTAAPAAVTGLTVIKSGGIAQAAWSLSPDLDVRMGGRIVIRHSPLTTGATWENGVILDDFNGDAVAGSLPLITGTYMAKALDSSGNYSATAATFVATEGMATGWSTVATTTQQTAFTGAKSNTAALDGALRLDSLATISSMATPISTWPKITALGGIAASGSYDFDTYVDLSTVATRRFEADVAVSIFDTGDLIGFRDLVSTWSSVSGAAVDDCDLTLYAATTDDNPAASPTWGPWVPFFVADFTCRAARFKAELASGSATHNIAVSTLAVDIKVPV